MPDKNLTVTFPEDIHEALKYIAKAEVRAVKQVVKDFTIRTLRNWKNPLTGKRYVGERISKSKKPEAATLSSDLERFQDDRHCEQAFLDEHGEAGEKYGHQEHADKMDRFLIDHGFYS